MQTLQKKTWRENGYLKAFLLGLLISFTFFIPFIIYDNGYFLFYGDFNVQQVPFYQMCHDAIRSGNTGWSWTTDLGANFVGSYSFYLLGSPFFWLTIPFPSEAVPYLMGPLLILKFGCASLTGFIFLKRYVRNPDLAVLGGLLYAFSGFAIYNIFFNHFHEAIIIFPLMLAALDEYMYHRRRGVFALAVCASCVFNYYFFVGQVVFCLIYWILRMLCKSWRISLRDFLLLALEAVLGVLMSCVLLVPSVLAVLQNNRVDDLSQGWNQLMYGYEQRYLHILECFFFPPDIPARPNFTPNSEAKWASLGAWLPLFSMTGFFAFFQMRRSHWLKKLIVILAVMAFVPILNSAFQMLNQAYYARWFYMLTLMLSLATVCALESQKSDWKRALKWTFGMTLAIALPIGLLPNTTMVDDVEVTTVGLEAYPTRFWSYVGIALLSLGLLTFVLRYYRKDPKKFLQFATGGVAVVTVVYASFFIALGKTQSWDAHKQLIPYSLNGGSDLILRETEDQFCRADFYESMDNQAMYWQMPTIQAFHSIVPGSVMEFYPSVGVTRDVGSRPEVEYYGLRGLLSVRWLFDQAQDTESFVMENGKTRMPGWVYYDTQNGFEIYENKYYIPMGFSYDMYMTEQQYDEISTGNRHLALLHALVLSPEQVEKYGSWMTSFSGGLSYTEEEYYEACLERKSMSCSSFSYDNEGFTAEFTSDKDRLVFFSVPYESGWSATVNGEPVEIEQVSVGFMAVPVGEGENTIRFTYVTPGLSLGFYITLGAITLFLLYIVLIVRFDRRHKKETSPRCYRVHPALPSAEEWAERRN